MRKRALILAGVYGAVGAVALAITLIFGADWISLIYLLLTLTGIYLNSIHIKEGLGVFALASALYVYINYTNKFYGEFALYIAIALYYAIFYLRSKKIHSSPSINSFKPYVWLIILAVALVIIPPYALLLKSLKTSQPLINSLLTFLTCTAVILTAARTWQQFTIWLSINIAQSLLWLTTLSTQNLSYLPIIIINIFLLSINTYNLIIWQTTYTRQSTSIA